MHQVFALCLDVYKRAHIGTHRLKFYVRRSVGKCKCLSFAWASMTQWAMNRNTQRMIITIQSFPNHKSPIHESDLNSTLETLELSIAWKYWNIKCFFCHFVWSWYSLFVDAQIDIQQPSIQQPKSNVKTCRTKYPFTVPIECIFYGPSTWMGSVKLAEHQKYHCTHKHELDFVHAFKIGLIVARVEQWKLVRHFPSRSHTQLTTVWVSKTIEVHYAFLYIKDLNYFWARTLYISFLLSRIHLITSNSERNESDFICFAVTILFRM